MVIRITCIQKDDGDHENTYVAISHLIWENPSSGDSKKSSRKDIYNFVKEGGYAFVEDAEGNHAKLTAAISHSGTEYVRTVADGTHTDNLLKLPECK